MRTFTAVVERCPDTGLYVGYVPGFPGAHTQIVLAARGGDPPLRPNPRTPSG